MTQNFIVKDLQTKEEDHTVRIEADRSTASRSRTLNLS